MKSKMKMPTIVLPWILIRCNYPETGPMIL